MTRDRCGARARTFAVSVLLMAASPGGAEPSGPAINPVVPSDTRETSRRVDPDGRFGLPVGPARPTSPPRMRMQDGERHRIALIRAGESADMLTDALWAAWTEAGFDTLYTCSTDDCGGFDFRLALPVLPLPEMAVNLADFRYVVGARRSPPGLAALLVSAMAGQTHAQLTFIAPAAAPAPALVISSAPDSSARADVDAAPQARGEAGVAARVDADLDADGRAVLEDVDFAPGSTALDGTDSDALSALAAWLTSDPARRVAIVGHTDWTGTPEVNMAVSRARAAAVAAALEARGARSAQITVAGAGSLAPRAANTTPEGRAANRRVEAVRLPDRP